MGTSRKPDEADKQRGAELGRLRRACGMTQAQLAEALGISTQQVGKYERGEDRIPMNRHELAMKILGGPVQVTAEFLEEASPFRGPREELAELKRLLARMTSDLARCQEIARSL